MIRPVVKRTLVVALAAGLAAAITPTVASAGTSAGTPAARPEPVPSAAAAGPTADAGMLAALRRDLGLTEAQARTRLATEYAATGVERELREKLGAGYGGAWMTADGRLKVAVTDRTGADQVRAAGAEPALVERGVRQLEAIKSRLDRTPPADGIASWYADVTTNTVVVLADPAAGDAATRFIRASGVDPDAVRVVATKEQPAPLYDVRGGDAYYIGSGRCSIGFSVVGGFVTAGHCGRAGTGVSGYNGVAMGTIQGSVFPGRDYGWVAVNANWTPTGTVNRYNSSTVAVDGSQEAVVGAAVCRSGSTTGWRCGTIQAKNATVNYPQGSVQNLTRTNACAEPGDSGGSWLAGQQAQGVTSGGSGNCSSGGTTYFQPVNPILSAYGLQLVTSGAPTASFSCESGASRLICFASHNSTTPVQLRWAVGGGHNPAWDNRSMISFGCSGPVSVSLTVTNEVGSGTSTRTVRCNQGPWP